jgi:MEMO1 family protein
LTALPRAHEAQPALTVVQPAIARADVALYPPVVQGVPVAPRLAGNGLIHRARGLRDRNGTDMVTESECCKVRAELQNTRPAAVAGQFYPADADRLRTDIQHLLAGSSPPADLAAKALIAPHAGYGYSGAVAAAAFAALRSVAAAIKRVVLIGPAHYVAVSGVAAPTVERFKTPLGDVAIDRQAIDAIADLPCVVRSDAPHAPEHALEVELPFLQSMLPAFRLVPLVVGAATAQDVAMVLGQLWGADETLIVVSSDLSHYLSYEAARRMDSGTATAIERGDWSTLGSRQACGHLAVAGLLIAAKRHGLHAQRLALCNSGDSAGRRDQVVGYGAWIFSDRRPQRS